MSKLPKPKVPRLQAGASAALREGHIDCRRCPLNEIPMLLAHQGRETSLIEGLRLREKRVKASDLIIRENDGDVAMATLTEGWAFRFKTLEDGRRQILNFLLPGDLIGVQQNVGEKFTHGVEALTDVSMCLFKKDTLWTLHKESATLAFKVTWMVAQEESMVDDHLLSTGQRSAEERIARLLMILHKRSRAIWPKESDDAVVFPVTQLHIADALGLSLVHTNKTLRKLEKRGLHSIDAGRLYIRDAHALARLGDFYDLVGATPKPFL